jgi:hypothetical protein
MGPWEVSPIGDSDRAFYFRIYSKLSNTLFIGIEKPFWEFWTNQFIIAPSVKLRTGTHNAQR